MKKHQLHLARCCFLIFISFFPCALQGFNIIDVELEFKSESSFDTVTKIRSSDPGNMTISVFNNATFLNAVNIPGTNVFVGMQNFVLIYANGTPVNAFTPFTVNGNLLNVTITDLGKVPIYYKLYNLSESGEFIDIGLYINSLKIINYNNFTLFVNVTKYSPVSGFGTSGPHIQTEGYSWLFPQDEIWMLLFGGDYNCSAYYENGTQLEVKHLVFEPNWSKSMIVSFGIKPVIIPPGYIPMNAMYMYVALFAIIMGLLGFLLGISLLLGRRKNSGSP